MKVNYKALRSKIIRSLRREHNTDEDVNELEFHVDIDKLSDLASEIGLSVLTIDGTESSELRTRDIPLLAEHYKGSSLSWFDSSKQILVLAFADSEEYNNLEEYSDDAKDLANIYANCSVYTVTIVSYKSNEPKFAGKVSYEISTRANKYALEHTTREESKVEDTSSEDSEDDGSPA